MATKIVATATVRALKGRKLIPTRAALTLVRRQPIDVITDQKKA